MLLTRQKNWQLYLLSFIAVIVCFQINFGLGVVWPTNISWLMHIKTDWNTHYLGWFYYRNEPWHFPIGKVSGYYYPLGTNVGFTDSIPLCAIFFKLFSPILPADFQYFGFWLLLCRLLIAFFTIRICELFSLKPFYIFLAVIFMTQNPVLLYRSMHPALCAHWLFLASGYLYLLDSRRVSPAKILRSQMILLLLSSLITPYLLILEFGFTAIIYWKLLAYDKSVKGKAVVKDLAINAVGVAGIWLICGMITFGNKEHLAINGGFGKLSMNLNAFFDPWVWSSLLPELKRVSVLQYEGFMYLGVGIFFLILVALVYRVTRTSKKTAPDAPGIVVPPLIAYSALLAFAAITNVVSLNDKILFTIPVPAIVTNTGDIFRASGRLFWPVYYLLLFWLIIGFARSKWPEGLKAGILCVALLIQLYDIKLLITFQQPTLGTWIPPVSQKWNGIIRQYDKVLFFPPFGTDYLGPQDYEYFAFIGARERKPIDIGYVARADYHAMQRYSDTMEAHLQQGPFDTGALYITTPTHLNQFIPAVQSDKLVMNELDGYYYFYDRRRTAGQNLAVDPAAVQVRDSAIRAFLAGKIELQPADSLGAVNDSISMNVESFVAVSGYISLSGWSYIKGEKNNRGDSLFIALKSDKRIYRSPMALVPRPDITAYFKADYLDDAGFKMAVFTDQVEKGTYQLAIVIKKKNGQWFYKLAGKEVEVAGNGR
jgi:Family of unknown function (DUF6311)